MFDTKTLDTEAEQVRITWSRYRGGRGTCVGVTGRTCAGDSRDNALEDILEDPLKNTLEENYNQYTPEGDDDSDTIIV